MSASSSVTLHSKKYRNDLIFQIINQSFVTVNEEDLKRTTEVIVDEVIKMSLTMFNFNITNNLGGRLHYYLGGRLHKIFFLSSGPAGNF